MQQHVIPDDLSDKLEQFARGCNRDVESLVREAIERLVDGDITSIEPGPLENGSVWNDASNQRRCELIDKKIQDQLPPQEQGELAALTQVMDEHVDKIAPIPLEGVRRLHAQLLKKKAGDDRRPRDQR